VHLHDASSFVSPAPFGAGFCLELDSGGRSVTNDRISLVVLTDVRIMVWKTDMALCKPAMGCPVYCGVVVTKRLAADIKGDCLTVKRAGCRN
jgi:hypothetical protein